METALEYSDRSFAYFSSDEFFWIRRIRKLKEQYPDEVSIEYEPETNDGCICAKVPVKWFKIEPPRKVNMTDEQKRAFADRMKSLRQ